MVSSEIILLTLKYFNNFNRCGIPKNRCSEKQMQMVNKPKFMTFFLYSRIGGKQNPLNHNYCNAYNSGKHCKPFRLLKVITMVRHYMTVRQYYVSFHKTIINVFSSCCWVFTVQYWYIKESLPWYSINNFLA